MRNLEYDGLTISMTLPDQSVCTQIVDDVAQILLWFSDCRSSQHRAFIIDQIARSVFRQEYETFLRCSADRDGQPWEVGVAPKWEGARDEFGDPIVNDDQGE